jgi:hypothetical protein
MGEKGKESEMRKERTLMPLQTHTSNQLVINRSNYDIRFYVFLRKIQLYLLPDIFLELKNQYFPQHYLIIKV